MKQCTLKNINSHLCNTLNKKQIIVIGGGAAGFFGPEAGLLAGALLGTTFLLSTEALIAKTDAVLCGTTTLALAALGRLYAETQAKALGGPPAGRRAVARRTGGCAGRAGTARPAQS